MNVLTVGLTFLKTRDATMFDVGKKIIALAESIGCASMNSAGFVKGT